MKGKRFTEEQIIRILQEAETGLAVADIAASTTALSSRFIAGSRNLVAWRFRRPSGYGNLNVRTVS